MNPSLFSLFQRGHYFSPPSVESETPNTLLEKEEHTELERFTVAAIAFCLHHDPNGFRRQFMGLLRGQSIGVYDDSCSSSGYTVKVEVGTLDLVIEDSVSIPNEYSVYVVEAKVYAPPAPHQRPSNPDFWEGKKQDAPAGYGHQIRERCRAEWKSATRVSYVTLGWKREWALKPSYPGVPGDMKSKWVPIRHVFWSDLASEIEKLPVSQLGQDIHNFLSRIGIIEFAMKSTNTASFGAVPREAVEAYLVLNHTCAYFGLKEKKHWHLGVPSSLDADIYFGADIVSAARQSKGANLDTLRALVRPDETVEASMGEPLCWFGYDSQKPTASVWLNCAAITKAELLKKRLSNNAPGDVSTTGRSVVIRRTDAVPICDRDWFIKVFESIGLKRA